MSQKINYTPGNLSLNPITVKLRRVWLYFRSSLTSQPHSRQAKESKHSRSNNGIKQHRPKGTVLVELA